ncbi:MAG: hypothetical protein A2X82_02805 [Geobacteraceae bacterium GWC2_55_20]|nr:MAG: hypothetical protein A2X82_02805 [Geobacteraceae bacterium GWC2_55_20]OGU19871.1 MAG: hypothetical protein A2X85_01440 [Geobacteraceae bacterium GWF2_54_21]HBA72819.1 GTPase-activating protein [Geobacter sp.]HCE67125.1 GTPase-activating protein [Geobacter sp.]
MFLLPKGKPLVENFPIAKLQLPEALDKLKNGKLTGCAIFDFPASDCALIYEEGKLISVLMRRNKIEERDADALRALVDQIILTDSGSFNVYGFTKEVNQAVLALLRGVKVLDRQELKMIDFKNLRERIKNERMTATLKISTDQSVGMILYRDGETVGFFDDTADAIESSPARVQQIATLPGATVDLMAIRGSDGLNQDLSLQVNIRSLWAAAKGDVFAASEPANIFQPQAAAATVQPPPVTANSTEVESAIIAIANASLGKLGKTLVDKELLNAGGIKALKDESKLRDFLNAVEKSSILLASANKIKEMRNAISLEVEKL